MREGPVTLQIIRDEESFLALAPYWDALHDSSAIRTPFRTWDWSRLWWKHFGSRYQLRVGVLRDAKGIPQAIAPFVLAREKAGHRRHLRHLTLLGGIGEVLSEGLDFLVPHGREHALLPRFVELFQILNREWDVVDLPMLHEESPSLLLINAMLEKVGLAGPRSAPQNAHVLGLVPSWDGMLATFSRNRRNDLRSKWKKMMANHQGRALAGGKDLDGGAAMEALIGVHRMRFAEAESSFIAPRALSFHRELVDTWMPQGRIMISLLEAEGSIAAGRYGYVFGGRYWDYQSGYDDKFSSISVGNLNLGWAVQNAISLGLKEYDHLGGDQSYKHAWSTRTRRLLHLESLNRLSPMALLFRLTRSVKRMVNRTEEGSPIAAQEASKPQPATA